MSVQAVGARFRMDYRLFNPLFYHMMKLMMDPKVRRITNYGGSSSGKTYSTAQAILVMTELDECNTIVFRKVGASISKTVWEDFKVAARQLRMYDRLVFKESIRQIVFPSGAKIDFQGLDNPEKIKGISNYKRVFKDELSEFDKADDDQIRKRLRGMEGQQIIDAFNPISEDHWIKKEYFDKEEWHDVTMDVELFGRRIATKLTKVKSIRMNAPKTIVNPSTGEIEEHPSDTVIIQTTYLNNFWVVGSPCGTFGFYDRQCVADFEKDRINNPDFYNVYALGEWGVIRTGSEFFGSFKRGTHTANVAYDPDLPIHVSVDNNVLPYISFTLWQADLSDGFRLTQFDEVCAGSPDNTVRKAARLVADKLKSYGADSIFLHGDASTKAANNIDDEKRSWLDLLIDALTKHGIEVTDCVGKKNPPVAMSGEFINAIFEGSLKHTSILIGENCVTSINDYMSVQKDVNGAILKLRVKNKVTGQSYEEHGHLCLAPYTPVVTKRGEIPICDVLEGDFVMTEKGWQKVYFSAYTIRKSHYFSLSLQGQKLDLTYDHPIFTNRGFVKASDLRSGDIITRYSKGDIWQEKLSSTTVLDFIATAKANVRAIGSIIAAGLGLTGLMSKHTSIVTSGISQTEKFQKGIVFIILMVITIIMHLTTLLLCVLTSMKSSMFLNLEKKLGSKLKKALLTTVKRPKNGMRPMKGGLGIPRMPRTCGRIKRSVNSSVSCVVKHSRVLAAKLQNFVQTTAKLNGEDVQELTMKSAIVRCVGLNLLSTSILKRSAVHGNVPLCIEGISDVYDISTSSHTFFANGVLVHNCDTFRYIVCDLLANEFTAFSNRRKRNIYASDGAISFYNPETECAYSEDIVYCMPNINGLFVLVHGKKCGEVWHIVDAGFTEATSTDRMKDTLSGCLGERIILECSKSYYMMARELRDELGGDVRAIHESPDLPRRIAATSDFVRDKVRFNERMMAEEGEYGLFVSNLLDYRSDTRENIEASAVISGFVQTVLKLGL